MINLLFIALVLFLVALIGGAVFNLAAWAIHALFVAALIAAVVGLVLYVIDRNRPAV